MKLKILTVLCLAASCLASCGNKQIRTVNDCGRPLHISNTQVDIIEYSGLTDEYVKAITPMIDRGYSQKWSNLVESIRTSEVMDDLALQIVNINEIHQRCIEEER